MQPVCKFQPRPGYALDEAVQCDYTTLVDLLTTACSFTTLNHYDSFQTENRQSAQRFTDNQFATVIGHVSGAIFQYSQSSLAVMLPLPMGVYEITWPHDKTHLTRDSALNTVEPSVVLFNAAVARRYFEENTGHSPQRATIEDALAQYFTPKLWCVEFILNYWQKSTFWNMVTLDRMVRVDLRDVRCSEFFCDVGSYENYAGFIGEKFGVVGLNVIPMRVGEGRSDEYVNLQCITKLQDLETNFDAWVRQAQAILRDLQIICALKYELEREKVILEAYWSVPELGDFNVDERIIVRTHRATKTSFLPKETSERFCTLNGNPFSATDANGDQSIVAAPSNPGVGKLRHLKLTCVLNATQTVTALLKSVRSFLKYSRRCSILSLYLSDHKLSGFTVVFVEFTMINAAEKSVLTQVSLFNALSLSDGTTMKANCIAYRLPQFNGKTPGRGRGRKRRLSEPHQPQPKRLKIETCKA